MYKVEKKPNTPNTVWDAKKGKVLCHFTGGILKTEDKNLANTLKGMGYTVTDETEPVAEKSQKADG